jgi:uroporphyrinogen decarboxylase
MTLQKHWENFLIAARGGEPEQVPVGLIIDSPWMPGFLKMDTLDFFLYPDRWLDAYLSIMARFPDVVFLPGFWVEYGMAIEPSAFGTPIMWRHDAPPALRHLDLPPADWGKLRVPDPQTDGLMPLALKRLLDLEQHGGLPEPHRIHFAAVRGPLAIATHVLGTTPFLEATASEPEAVEQVLDVLTETVISYLQAQLNCLREPLGILVLDDIPGMLSPRAFNRVALPVLQRIFGAFEGLIRMHHNDTPCAHLLPHLPKAGFDVFNFSHELDIAEVKATFGPKIALLGNVAPLSLLVRGTPEEVEAEARRCIEKAAPGGGFILSAGGGVSPGTPAANIDALIRAATT